MCRSAYPFFGLTDEYIAISYQQMYDMERFSFIELYTMPVPRRNFFVRCALKRQEEEKRAMEKSRGVNEATPVSRKEMAKVPSFVINPASSKS